MLRCKAVLPHGSALDGDVIIKIDGLFKIFGREPEEAFALLDKGMGKDEIFSKTGQTVGVRDVSMDIREGEIFVVMGLSGSGKSTLIRLINRLIEPSRGRIAVRGNDVVGMDTRELIDLRRKDLAMVFQSFALMTHRTVIDNAAFGLEVAGIDKTKRRERAREALEQVGLGANADSYPDELSGGMQQRVGLARALASDPSILLMDEAFSALDPLIRTEMQDELLRLQAEQQRTVVFISHDLDEAMRIGDRIAIMEGGRIVQVGTPEDILQNPADDYVRAFFRGVDPTNILTAGDIASDTQVTIPITDGKNPRAALQRLIKNDRDYGYVIDSERRFKGVVSSEGLRELLEQEEIEHLIPNAYLEDVATGRAGDSMQDILPEVASHAWPLPILDDEGKYLGAISKNLFLRTLHRSQPEEATAAEEQMMAPANEATNEGENK